MRTPAGGPARERRGLAVAWTIVGGIFALGVCCGSAAAALTFLLY